MMDTDQNSYWLFDAGALTSTEFMQIHGLPGVHPLYKDLGEPVAEALGPVLAVAHPVVDGLAALLMGDLSRCWAISQIFCSADANVLSRHLLCQRFVRTQDHQRYFLRYADTRSRMALWSVLTSHQKRALVGPINTWLHVDRHGRSVQLDMSDRAKAWPDGSLGAEIILGDAQLARLLELIWPDQLLSCVLEENPSIKGKASPAWMHDMSCLVCEWYRLHGEERYPIQKACLATLLIAQKIDADLSMIFDDLKRIHAAYQAS